MNRREIIERVKAWLRYPALAKYFGIGTHLTDAEKLRLYELAVGLGDSGKDQVAIVEIGSYLGASACFLAAGLKQGGVAGKVYCVDTWANDAMSEGKRDTMEAFLRNTEPLREFIHPVRGWSTQVVPEIARLAGTIDLLFIDGDHAYESCLADWNAYKGLLADGAVVALHDIGWAEGVQRVVREEVAPATGMARSLPNLWSGRMNPEASEEHDAG